MRFAFRTIDTADRFAVVAFHGFAQFAAIFSSAEWRTPLRTKYSFDDTAARAEEEEISPVRINTSTSTLGNVRAGEWELRYEISLPPAR